MQKEAFNLNYLEEIVEESINLRGVSDTHISSSFCHDQPIHTIDYFLRICLHETPKQLQNHILNARN